MQTGAVLIDIRSDSQRAADGVIPGAISCPATCSSGGSTRRADRDPSFASADARVLLLCDEGYQSSLAAATLRSGPPFWPQAAISGGSSAPLPALHSRPPGSLCLWLPSCAALRTVAGSGGS